MKISEITAEELDRWSAEKVMGWVLGTALIYRDKDGNKIIYQQDDQGRVAYMSPYIWQPSNPEMGQIWMVIERMQELGWYFTLNREVKRYKVNFWHFDSYNLRKTANTGKDQNPCLAILKAAHEALEGE